MVTEKYIEVSNKEFDSTTVSKRASRSIVQSDNEDDYNKDLNDENSDKYYHHHEVKVKKVVFKV